MDLEAKILNSTYTEVEIPEEISGYVMQQTKCCGKYIKKRTTGNSTHHLIKRMGFFLLLKAEVPKSGCIKSYVKQVPALSNKFNISRSTFYSYLNQLEEMKLVSRDAAGNLLVASWHQLGDTLGIRTNKRTKINFNYAYF